MNEIERTFIRTFVVPERQERLIGLVETPKRRAKLRSYLAHFRDLDRRFARKLEGTEQTLSYIFEYLTEQGAGEQCWLISESQLLDGKQLPLREAIESVLGYGIGTFLICIPDRLGYYEGDGQSERYLLEKRNTTNYKSMPN